jgi:retron-type reverse transcriptase
LTAKLQFGKINYVVEADIQGFFDNLDREFLLNMLAERIDDKALLYPETNTSQGRIISQTLANVYLHHAPDVWFQKVVISHCTGKRF